MQRVFEFTVPPTRGHAPGSAEPQVRRVTLVGVNSGLAAGHHLQLKGNAQLEWWSIFTSIDQLDTCLAGDSLRFQDPRLFAQVIRELEHVTHPSSAHRVDSRAGTSTGLCSPSP